MRRAGIEKNKKNTRVGSFALRAHAVALLSLAWVSKLTTPAP